MRKCNSSTISSCTQADVFSAGRGKSYLIQIFAGLLKLIQEIIEPFVALASQRAPFLEVTITRKISLAPYS